MKKTILLATAAFPLLVAGMPTAFAQDATGDDVSVQDVIVVTGSRARAQDEIAQKQDRDVVFDSLSQDEIAAIPDFNVADALRRIAGVATEFDEDEGRFVNVRGIDSNLNYITFDGIGVPSTGSFGDGGRNVNIEFFPSTAVKRLDIYKTFTPDIDGSSIGGYVDVVTRSAFDQDDMFFVGKATLSHYTADDIADDQDGVDLPFRLEATYSNTFGNADQFGVVLTGLYGQRPREQDRLFTVGSYGGFDNVSPPTRFDSSLTSNNQLRFGGQGKFEYRSGESYGALSGYWYRQEENETRFRNNLRINSGDITEVGTDQALVSQARMEINFDYFPIETQGKGLQAHWEQGLFGGNFDADIGWAEQNFDHDTPAFAFRTPFVPELGVGIDASGVVPTRTTYNDPSYFSNPDNYDLYFLSVRDLNTDETVFNALTNYGYNNLGSDRGWGFKTGLSLRNLERVRDNEEWRFPTADLNALAATTDLSSLLATDSFRSDYSPDDFLFFDIAASRSFVAGLDVPRDVGRSTSGDFTYEEDILAAYGMLTYRTDRLDVIAGGRLEATDFNSSAAGNEANEVSGDYTSFLPSVNVSYDLADGLVLRGAFSRTLGRPNPSDLTVTRSETVNTEGVTTIRQGNPDLQPRESDNFDLSLEYYFLDGEGLLSAAVFQKNIDGDIYTTTEDAVIDGETVIITQARNASESEVRGLELQAYLGNMPFLPEPLQPFGISANATFLDGEMTLADGTVLDRRVRQGDFIGNAAVFYNTGDFEARFAYNYTDAFPIQLGGSGFTRTDDSFEQIDASVRYYYGDNLVFSVEGRNLTDERRRQLNGDEDAPLFGETILGRQFHFGVSYRY